MRRRVPAGLMRRVGAVAKRRRVVKGRIHAQRVRQPKPGDPCMLVPAPIPMAEWTRLAAQSQVVLKKHVTNDTNGPIKYSAEVKKYMSNLHRKF